MFSHSKNSPFSSFNPSLKVDFQGSRVTSDGGLVLVRELDERLGFRELIAQHSTDSRGKNTRLPLADLLRQSIYSRMAGCEDVNDAEPLAHDPTFRLMGSERIWERGAALTSRVQSFETELLTRGENLSGLAAINRELLARAEAMEFASDTQPLATAENLVKEVKDRVGLRPDWLANRQVPTQQSEERIP